MNLQRLLGLALGLAWLILFGLVQLYPWAPTNPAQHKSLPGYLVFRLQPPQATIWIDGKKHTREERGATLSTGRHHIRAEAPGYFPTQRWIHVRGDDATMLRLRLTPRPVQVEISSQPAGARLFLNEKPMGRTPFRGSLRPRWYAIRVTKPSYMPAQRDHQFHPNRPIQRYVLRLGGAPQVRPRDQATMLWIPGRIFRRGSSPEQILQAQQLCQQGMKRKCPERWFTAERPQRKLKLNDFWIDQYEITQQQYEKCVVAGVCKASTRAGKANHPVTGVTWQQAQTYCTWVGARLPTEAEWELAARGPHSLIFPWGQAWAAKRSNHGRFNTHKQSSEANPEDGFPALAPIGSFPKGRSPYRLHDMAGNAAEWVEDCFHTSYYRRAPFINPVYRVQSCSSHTIRGGSYLSPPWELRTTARQPMPPDFHSPAVGFRCARTPKRPKPRMRRE